MSDELHVIDNPSLRLAPGIASPPQPRVMQTPIGHITLSAEPKDISDDQKERLLLAEQLAIANSSGVVPDYLLEKKEDADNYLLAGLLGLHPTDIAESLKSGKSIKEVVAEQFGTHESGAAQVSLQPDGVANTTGGDEQPCYVVKAERLQAQVPFLDPDSPLESRILDALQSIGFQPKSNQNRNE